MDGAGRIRRSSKLVSTLVALAATVHILQSKSKIPAGEPVGRDERSQPVIPWLAGIVYASATGQSTTSYHQSSPPPPRFAPLALARPPSCGVQARWANTRPPTVTVTAPAEVRRNAAGAWQPPRTNGRPPRRLFLGDCLPSARDSIVHCRLPAACGPSPSIFDG